MSEYPVLQPDKPYNSWNYVNKEISWLLFNKRILQESTREDLAPLDRLNFLSIWRSNLDEFIQVRVGALIHKKKINPDYTDPINGQTRDELLNEILEYIDTQYLMATDSYEKLLSTINPLSVQIGDSRPMINVLQYGEKIAGLEDLEPIYQKYRNFIDITIVRKGDPMPIVESGKTYIVVNLTNKKETYGIIDLSRLPTWMNFTPEDSSSVQTLVNSTVFISQYITRIFKNHVVNGYFPFRILRNADIMLSSESCKGNELFQKFIRKMVHHRKFMRPICMQILFTEEEYRARRFAFEEPSLWYLETVNFLCSRFNLKPEEDVYRTSLPFDINFGSAILEPNKNADHPLISTPYQHLNRQKRLEIPHGQLINYLKGDKLADVRQANSEKTRREMLLHFPYDSMITFINLIYEAANRADCKSISITLYRMAENSRIAAALAYAASMGKCVTCILELRARFNETSNADYSEYFRNSGCNVVYGLPEYKVHCKICLIEGNDWAINVVGTGNFNEKSAMLYSDLLYIKGERYPISQLTVNLRELFRRLINGDERGVSGVLYSGVDVIKKKILEELDHQKDLGKDGYVCLKANGLDDPDIVKKIIECETAGVSIDLIIRGICTLIPLPTEPGSEQNLRVISVIGRYLEHSRIFWFGKDDAETKSVYIGSADLRERNLNNRIEAMVKIDDSESLLNIKRFLNIQISPRSRSYHLQPELGTYVQMGTNDIHAATQRYIEWTLA